MRALGFHEQWINWVMICVTTVSFGVLINGQVGDRFQPSRDLRQGDPLSSFLFILCTEILILRLKREDTDQRFKGVQITPQAPAISHLFFADDSLFFSSIHDSQLLYLKRILEDYREASGQQVNFTKSSIIYGKTITDSEKQRVKTETGIIKEGGSGTYLGLPEAIAGSKIETVQYVEENLNARVNSWKAKFLSHGGKETLLKSVAFALPTYTMSCFLLPKTTIQRLNQEFSNFWWKNQQTSKGIHWLSWDKLIKPKQEGGMGFRDLEGTNMALLGKQYWRLVSNQSSLLSRTLKARYHPRSTITHATVGTRPSFGWSSLMAAAKLVRTGLKKDIGNDTSFNMWEEPWILDQQPRPPIPLPHILREDWNLSDFKENDSDQWIVPRLYQVFDREEVARILQVKPGGTGSRSSFTWIHTDSGIYSVKSGYKLWLSHKRLASHPVPEHTIDHSVIFTRVWSLSTSPKLRNFLWRCLRVSVPVGSALKKKKIAQDSTCALCGEDNETVEHTLFQCDCARALWSLTPYAAILQDESCSIQGKIFTCMQMDEAQHEEDKYLWTWIIWRLWKLRNEKVFRNTNPDIVAAFNLARTDHEEWRVHQSLNTSLSPTGPIITEVNWQPPPFNVLKCNVDASWQDTHDRCGVSWILRIDTGRVKFWGTKTYAKLFSPLYAEAAALTWAVMCIRNMGYEQVVFESDSATLIDALNGTIHWPRLNSYTSEILHMVNQSDRRFRFCKVNRKGNQAADKLAKYAKDLPLYSGTIDNLVLFWLCPALDHTL